MLQCGQRAPTTQDMNIEWFQCYDNTKYIRENCLLNPFINKDSYLIFQIKGIAAEVVNIKRVTIEQKLAVKDFPCCPWVLLDRKSVV